MATAVALMLATPAPASAHVQQECRIITVALAIAMQASSQKWIETGQWAQTQRGTLRAGMSRDEVLNLFVAFMQRIQDGLEINGKVNEGIAKFAECLNK